MNIRKNREKIKILYLDDDEENLLSFKANFRKDFDIATVSKPQEALEYLANNEVHIVLSDQRMPDLSGVEFFELLLLKFPDPVRILVTGYSDINAIIAAINDGDVYKYIKKPWVREDVLLEIQNAYDYYKVKSDAVFNHQELVKKTKELEKFIYSASHDLRAPIATVLGLLKVTRTEHIPDNLDTYFKMIEESVKDMDFYIQNMINFYQNQTAAVSNDTIDFKLILENLLTNLKPINAQKQVAITTTITQTVPFVSDEKRIVSALSNLMSNAILYSDPTKAVKTVALNVDVDKEEARITIIDNGIGMKNNKNLFELYIHDSKKRGFGSGLGLYVSKNALDRVDGKIKITSVLEVGTTINITIPNKNG